MDQNKVIPENDEAQDSGEYAVRRNVRADVVAAIVCLLLAVVTWVVIMNHTDTDYLAIDTSNLSAGYSISVTELEVTGKVTDLRRAGKITVMNPPSAAGTYNLHADDLILPEGLTLVGTPEIILTVTE